MEYRIEYACGRCCNRANGRKDLLEWLVILKDEAITNIEKVYKDGKRESVLKKYESYIRKTGVCDGKNKQIKEPYQSPESNYVCSRIGLEKLACV